jgi:predicted Zn-dependent peptidase
MADLLILADRYLPGGGDVFAQGLRLLSDLLRDPALDDEGALRAAEVAQEAEKLRRFIAGLINDKGTYAVQRCLGHMCPREPYGVFEYGRLEDLERVTGAALEARRRSLWDTAEVDIYVVGAIEPERALEAVGAAFPLDRAAPPALRGTTAHPPPEDPKEVVEALPGLNQAKLCMGLRSGIRLHDPAYFDQLMMHGILGGFPHSKLFRNVREGAGLCYDASSSMERFKGLVFMFAGIDAANFEQTRDLCLEQLAALGRGEVSEEELGSTRAGFHQAFRAVLDSPSGTVNLDYVMRMGERSSAPEDLIAAVDAVTVEGIQAAAQQLRLDTVYFLEPAAQQVEGTPAAAAAAPEPTEA